LDTFLQDIRYGFRSLMKDPSVTLVAVFCLVLGIGLNVTIYSTVDAMLVRPFPFFADQERLAVINGIKPSASINDDWISYPDYREMRDGMRSFAEMSAFGISTLTISDGDRPERYEGGLVTWNSFGLLGVRPIMGRDFRQEDDRPGAAPVVMLSHRVWRDRYASDPAILGKPIRVNGQQHTVIGVMPEKFEWQWRQVLWIPLEPQLASGIRASRTLLPVARLAKGATFESATAEVEAIAKRLAEMYPGDNRGWSATVIPLRESLVEPETKLIVLAMLGAVTCVLLISCANVANLLLARATVRQRELALRAALGAGRGRIIRQMLTESMVLALLAVPAGILLGWWGLDLIAMSFPPEEAIPWYIQLHVNTTVVLFTVGAALLTGIVFGLGPAFQAVRRDLQGTLREGSKGSVRGGRNRLRNALVVGEVALSMILLVGAALFVRSFMNIQRAQLGYDVSHVMTTRVHLTGERYDSLSARLNVVNELIRRVGEIPGVERVGVSPLIPLGGGTWDDGGIVEGHPVQAGDEPQIEYAGVAGDYLGVLGIRVLKGRAHTPSELTDGSPLAVINTTMARELWKGAEPVGSRFRLAHDSSSTWYTVIGVAPDTRVESFNGDRDTHRVAYVPLRFTMGRSPGIMVKTTGAPAAITSQLRAAVRAVDPDIALYRTKTLDEVRQLSAWVFEFFTVMFAIFGGFALLLAVVGVYGVIAYGVSQRTHEIGVRVALGARRNDVLRLIVGQGVALAAAGALVGMVGATGVTHVLRYFLFEVSSTDVPSYLSVAVLLVGVGMVASYIPARRASGVDPIVALRAD
jgi:putative ABC transport system permease protein